MSAVANAASEKAKLVDELGEPAGAIAARAALLDRLGAAGNIARRTLCARTMFSQAIALHGVDRTPEAIDLLRAVAEQFADVRTGTQPHLAADALYLQGLYCYREKRYEDAVSAVDSLLERYGETPQVGAGSPDPTPSRRPLVD